MRIVVSGTHASGKSTLISDFALKHPEFAVWPDPFELVEDAGDAPSAALFAEQLDIAADRLADESGTGDVIAERGPLDFLAYLLALAELTGRPLDNGLHEHAVMRCIEILGAVDVLVVLPLGEPDPIHVSADEYLELRQAMNDTLLDLIDDPELVGQHVEVVEVSGSPDQRLAALEALLAGR